MSEEPKVAKITRRRRGGDDADEPAPQETAEQPKRAARARAPKAAEVAPEAMPSLHTDPAALGAEAAAVVDAGDRSAAAAHPPAGGAATNIFEIAYDAYTAADLYALLRRLTRQEVEKRMVEHEQQLQEKQRGPQVERFLDAAATVTNNNNNSKGDSSKAAEEMCGYNYGAMLGRLFAALNRNKESSAMTEPNRLPEPKLEKIGKKKVIITNFGRICQAFHRPIEDVKDYIEKELSVSGNLDSNDALILKYEIQKSTAFDKILYKYLDEYVKCNSCHRIDTTLTKTGRRLELRCNWCTATRSVQAVGSATYSAQVGKRSKARLQAMTL